MGLEREVGCRILLQGNMILPETPIEAEQFSRERGWHVSRLSSGIWKRWASRRV